jgi:uncharacterized protein
LKRKNVSSKPDNHTHSQRAVIYDVLYGFIEVTPWEEEIINSPFFQRLRWVKQLGFSNYIFPGAEHNRFAHAIGVMNSMQKMIDALEVGVPKTELFQKKTRSEKSMLHKCLRIAALLHDIGTFPFSHAIEYSYMRHGNDQRRPLQRKGRSPKSLKDLPNTHEHLGSFIIKNTHYKGGITEILDRYGLDVKLISKIIKGESSSLVANQLMHSDLDADRMDYLLRDAHYTGVSYGEFDRDYILANLALFDAGKGQTGFGIRESATHAIEYFLIARFSWYSQIIKNPDSAKFDVMASRLASHYLDQDLIHQFQDLLTMVEEGDQRFFWWNDMYFMTRCQEVLYHKLHTDPRVLELTERLVYRRPPKTLHDPLWERKILQGRGQEKKRKASILEIKSRIQEFEDIFKKYGNGTEWVLADIPEKDVIFATPSKTTEGSKAIYRERDPIKLILRDGSPALLLEQDNSLMKHLSGLTNFVPSVYANDSGYDLLKKKKMISG